MRILLIASLIVVSICSIYIDQPEAFASSMSATLEAGVKTDNTSSTAAEVLSFEKKMEAAVLSGDVTYLNRICANDFSFTHGDGWVTGDQPLKVENKAQWLQSIASRPYLSRDLKSVQVELHGDIAITYGMYESRYRAPANPKQVEFKVWFERVYARRNGQWQFVSHRTVHGPTFFERVVQ